MLKRNNLLKFEIFSTIFIIIIGALLHFTYEWSNNNLLIGAFSAVNESIWEHLKILFFPMLISTVLGYFYLKNEYPTYICTKTKGILISLSFIIVFYYTYSGIIGTHFAIIDIISFIFAIILGEAYTYYKIKNANYNYNNTKSYIILIILTISFILFTFYTPRIGIFKNPKNNTYGINNLK